MYAPRACLVPAEARRRYLIHWKWSYRRLYVYTGLLEVKFESSKTTAATALNHWAICGSLNELSPINLGHLNTWSPIGGCLGRIRSLARGTMSLWVDFEVSNACGLWASVNRSAVCCHAAVLPGQRHTLLTEDEFISLCTSKPHRALPSVSCHGHGVLSEQ